MDKYKSAYDFLEGLDEKEVLKMLTLTNSLFELWKNLFPEKKEEEIKLLIESNKDVINKLLQDSGETLKLLLESQNKEKDQFLSYLQATNPALLNQKIEEVRTNLSQKVDDATASLEKDLVDIKGNTTYIENEMREEKDRRLNLYKLGRGDIVRKMEDLKDLSSLYTQMANENETLKQKTETLKQKTETLEQDIEILKQDIETKNQGISLIAEAFQFALNDSEDISVVKTSSNIINALSITGDFELVKKLIIDLLYSSGEEVVSSTRQPDSDFTKSTIFNKK